MTEGANSKQDNTVTHVERYFIAYADGKGEIVNSAELAETLGNITELGWFMGEDSPAEVPEIWAATSEDGNYVRVDLSRKCVDNGWNWTEESWTFVRSDTHAVVGELRTSFEQCGDGAHQHHHSW